MQAGKPSFSNNEKAACKLNAFELLTISVYQSTLIKITSSLLPMLSASVLLGSFGVLYLEAGPALQSHTNTRSYQVLVWQPCSERV